MPDVHNDFPDDDDADDDIDIDDNDNDELFKLPKETQKRLKMEMQEHMESSQRWTRSRRKGYFKFSDDDCEDDF